MHLITFQCFTWVVAHSLSNVILLSQCLSGKCINFLVVGVMLFVSYNLDLAISMAVTPFALIAALRAVGVGSVGGRFAIALMKGPHLEDWLRL